MKEPQVDCNPIFKQCIFLALWLIANAVYAVDIANLNVGSIAGRGWKLEGVALAVIDLNQKKPQFTLSATKLTLPKPFHDLSLADIRCNNFTWDHDELHCNQGRAFVHSAYWQSPTTNFSFHLSPKLNTFKLEDARLAGSRLSLHAEFNGENWQGKVQAKHISNNLIDKLSQSKPTKLKQAQSKQGRLNLTGTFSGKKNSVQAFNFTAEVEGLTDQSKDGKIAAEKLNLQTHREGKKSRKTAGKADIQLFTYQHPDVGTLIGNANGYYRDGIKIDKAAITLKSNTLQGLLTTYINPFFTESPFTGVSIAGGMDAQFSRVHFMHHKALLLCVNA